MKESREPSDEANNATIDRAEFDSVMQKLLRSKRPITKQEIAERIKLRGRSVLRERKRSDRQ
jgi:hypothetical protein